MDRGSTFSLTVMVIIMALLAVFIGYLLGNWLIQMVTGNTDNSHQVVKKQIIQEDKVQDQPDQQSSSQYSSSSNQISSNSNQTNVSKPTENSNQKIEANKQDYIKNQMKGDVFVVQVGAFNNINNARKIQQELEQKGFQVVITDGIPHKVQLGATTNRKEAEDKEKEVKALGYNAFITH